MKPHLFSYRKYKEFLRDAIDGYPQNGRGLRKKLAAAAGCQVPYVSHVLNGTYDFSPEQIEGISRFLGLSQDEKEYLIHLVLFERAGTESLRLFYKAALDRLTEKNFQLKERINAKSTLDEHAKATYYSSWYFAAIHMLTTIPEFQSREKISQTLQLPIARVDQVIEFLLQNGLMEKKHNRLLSKSADLHLDNDSPLIAKLHTNWRLQALQSLDNQPTQDLHYSLVFTIAEEDIPKVRETLTKALEKCATIIRPSKEENLAALCVDLFRVSRK
jgi:uncharacterized protein (TIGR02147 family)